MCNISKLVILSSFVVKWGVVIGVNMLIYCLFVVMKKSSRFHHPQRWWRYLHHLLRWWRYLHHPGGGQRLSWAVGTQTQSKYLCVCKKVIVWLWSKIQNYVSIMLSRIVPSKRSGRVKTIKVSIFPCLLIHYYILMLCSDFDVLSSAGNWWGWTVPYRLLSH